MVEGATAPTERRALSADGRVPGPAGDRARRARPAAAVRLGGGQCRCAAGHPPPARRRGHAVQGGDGSRTRRTPRRRDDHVRRPLGQHAGGVPRRRPGTPPRRQPVRPQVRHRRAGPRARGADHPRRRGDAALLPRRARLLPARLDATAAAAGRPTRRRRTGLAALLRREPAPPQPGVHAGRRRRAASCI